MALSRVDDDDDNEECDDDGFVDRVC